MLVVDHFWHVSFGKAEKIKTKDFKDQFTGFFEGLLC